MLVCCPSASCSYSIVQEAYTHIPLCFLPQYSSCIPLIHTNYSPTSIYVLQLHQSRDPQHLIEPTTAELLVQATNISTKTFQVSIDLQNVNQTKLLVLSAQLHHLKQQLSLYSPPNAGSTHTSATKLSEMAVSPKKL